MKSTITRERLEQLANFKGAPVTRQEEQELARMALAAMDSEPVAEVCEDYAIRYISNGPAPKEGLRPGDKLYRHAQTVPVVSADLLHTAASAIEDLLTTKDRTGAGVWFDLPFRLRSAANAQPEPVVQCPFPCGWDNLNKLAIQDAALIARGLVEGEPTTEAQRQAAISNNDRLLKVISACRAAMLQAEPVTTANKLGNSLVIQDTWIPVSERMPGSQEWVIVFAKWANQQILCWDDAENRWTDFEDQSYHAAMFTHWMPLPSAPQEVK